MSSMLLYWILKFDSIIEMIKHFSVPVTVLVSISIGIFIISWLVQAAVRSPENSPDPDDVKKADAAMKRWRKGALTMLCWSLPFYFVFHLAIGLIPTTQQMAIIYIVPRVLANKDIKDLPEKFVQLAGDWATELKPENIKSDVKGLVNTIVEKKNGSIKSK
jgi:predicted Co/Zn/Cd cation transporter (cation efflux family)